MIQLILAMLVASQATAQPVMTASPPDDISASLKASIERHKKSKAQLLDGLSDSKPGERVGCALLIWKKFPEEQARVLKVMNEDSDLDVRRRIAAQLARQHNEDALKLLEQQFAGKFDLTKEASADLYLILAQQLTEVTGKPHGVEGAFTILEAPPSNFGDAESRYPKNGELRKDGLRIMAASFLAERPELAKNQRLQRALESYFQMTESKVKSLPVNGRRHWEGRLWTILNVGLRAKMPELALKYSDRIDLMSETYNRNAFQRIIDQARSKDK